MSDQKDGSFCFSSQSAACERENDGFPNNKHASFTQKHALLNFMVEHKELAMRDNRDEALWNDLAQMLNNIPGGAVRQAETWKKTWRLWTASVMKKKNDLSITLLDLQLVSFLENLSEAEKLKASLKAFVSNETTLNSEELGSIMSLATPQILKDNDLTQAIEKLKRLEVEELEFQFENDASTNRLSELITLKQEIENEATFIMNKLDQNENKEQALKTEKIDLLNVIRNHLSLQNV